MPASASTSLLPRRLSPAAIDRYRRCPRTAYLQFVAKAPADTLQTAARTVGNAIHGALEHFFALDPMARDERQLHRALRVAWLEQPHPGPFRTREEEAYYGCQALSYLSGFLERFDASRTPVGRERWLQAPLPNGTVVFGKVDRLDMQRAASGQRCLDIVDYKSGWNRLDDLDLPGDTAALAYLLAAEATLGLPVRRIRYLYLAHGDEARWEVEREDVHFARERMDLLTREMHRDRAWSARPGPHCAKCPFRRACDQDAATAAAGRDTCA